MKKDELIIQIKQILFDEYFPVSERNKWEFLIPKMSEGDLQILLDNLKLKTKALFNLDQTLYKLGKTCEANIDIDKKIDKEAEKHPLQDLSEENLILLLTEKLSPWLEKNIDLKKEIEIYLSFGGDPAEFSKKLLEALTTNNELIGKNNIIKLTGAELKPTIFNWLKDYEEKVGNKSNRILARTGYLTNSQNIQKLLPGEKEKVKKIIELYDFLKYPISPFSLPGRVLLSPAVRSEPPTFTSPPLSPPSPSSITKKEPEKTQEKSVKPSFKPPVRSSQPVSSAPSKKKAVNLEEKYLEEEREK